MSHQVSNATLDSVQALSRAPSILKVRETFRQAADRHGYSSFLCSAPPNAQEKTVNPILFEEWPSTWRRDYIKRRYHVHDPMLKQIFRTANPFLWSETMQQRASSRDELNVTSRPSARASAFQPRPVT